VSEGRPLLEAVLRAGLAAADPYEAVRRHVRRDGGALAVAGHTLEPGARLTVVAAGKAAAAMAAGLEAVAGDRIARGLVVTKDGHGLPLAHCALREAGHPIPDARGVAAARDVLSLVAEAPPSDVLVVLLSGGASALLACPLAGLTLADLAETTRLLLGSGADIAELNAVRKHLVDVAGGRLARAAAAHCIEVLVVSDVLGDRLDVIGSGPCAPDPTTYADALCILQHRALDHTLPEAVREHLAAGARGERPESAKPGEPGLLRVRTCIVASNRLALEASRRESERRGWSSLIVTEHLRGEARVAGRRLAALARSVSATAPTCLLAGGETTVTLRGRGRGGRNQELALAAALELAGSRGVVLLAVGTDGSDGPTDAAGGFADGETVARGEVAGLDARRALEENDSYSFFAAEGGLLRTGPTRTNVMDWVALLVAPPPAAR
jgi:glycerate 2-kinase